MNTQTMYLIEKLLTKQFLNGHLFEIYQLIILFKELAQVILNKYIFAKFEENCIQMVTTRAVTNVYDRYKTCSDGHDWCRFEGRSFAMSVNVKIIFPKEIYI